MKRFQSVFMSIVAFSVTVMASGAAMAMEREGGSGSDTGMMALAVAIGIAIAAAAGAFGQSRAAAAALEGISRNPNAADKVFVPMILGLAFIESLVLFTWVLMFLMQQKF